MQNQIKDEIKAQNQSKIVFDSQKLYRIHSVIDENYVFEIQDCLQKSESALIINKISTYNNQKFIITPVECGYYSIKALHSDKLLDLHGWNFQNGALLMQSDSHLSTNQQFYFHNVKDDEFAIEIRCSGKVMDIQGGLAISGKNIIQHDWHQGKNQRFKIKEAKSHIQLN